jgi:lipopolysaccharide transport system ATP-binding protein
MSNTVISVENLSKSYRLGQIGTGRLADDFKIWWAKKRGKSNPFLKIDETDHGNRDSETIWALKDVNCSVELGETLGIIGRNGAGKSTLLKILSQVTAPTSGLVKIKGRIASLLEVGTGFHPDLTGRENIYLNGAILGMTKDEVSRKLDEIVDFSGVEKFIDTPVKRYSSGMYVRLAFAVAAHLEPEILVVDEVLAVGDAAFQAKCLGKMGNIAREGRTVLFVSHSMASVSKLCQKGILLQSGKIVMMGQMNEVVQQYLGGIQKDDEVDMNLAERQDRQGDGRLRFTKLSLYENSGNKIDYLKSGSDVKIVIEYASTTNTNLKNVLVTIYFENLFGERVVALQNSYSDGEFKEISPNGSFTCRIPKLSLMAGIYSVSLYSEINGVCADWIIGAGLIKVEVGDFYGTGKYPDAQDGKMLMEHSWDHLPTSY